MKKQSPPWFCKTASLLLHRVLDFAAKRHYVWQGVISMISQQIHDIKIVANSHYVCQGT